MVIGSGPIIIGQAAEFDYAGTQACKCLREEGISTVLINSNPATIMTYKEIADAIDSPHSGVGAGLVSFTTDPESLFTTVEGEASS